MVCTENGDNSRDIMSKKSISYQDFDGDFNHNCNFLVRLVANVDLLPGDWLNKVGGFQSCYPEAGC